MSASTDSLAKELQELRDRLAKISATEIVSDYYVKLVPEIQPPGTSETRIFGCKLDKADRRKYYIFQGDTPPKLVAVKNVPKEVVNVLEEKIKIDSVYGPRLERKKLIKDIAKKERDMKLPEDVQREKQERKQERRQAKTQFEDWLKDFFSSYGYGGESEDTRKSGSYFKTYFSGMPPTSPYFGSPTRDDGSTKTRQSYFDDPFAADPELGPGKSYFKSSSGASSSSRYRSGGGASGGGGVNINKKEKAEDILKGYGITTRKEWRNWLLKNHPDKSIDIDATSDTQRVLSAGREMGF